MTEKNNIPQIQTVELKRSELPKPELSKAPVSLPASIALARMQQSEQITKTEIANLRRWYHEGVFNREEIQLLIQNGIIEEPKNIFQLIQEQGMKSLFDLAVNFVKNNWRTTVAGFAATVATWLAAKGVSLGQHEIDAIMAIGYAIVFKFSNVKWDVATVVGVILMLASFFVSPVIGALGVGLDAGIITIIQLGLQQAVGALLKDQKQIFLPESQEAQ